MGRIIKYLKKGLFLGFFILLRLFWSKDLRGFLGVGG